MSHGGLLIASDLHAHSWSRFATTLPNGTNSRVADLWKIFDQLESYIEEWRPTYVVIPGDLTHRRYFVQFSIYTELMRRITRLREEYGVGIIVLVGNHDIESEGHHSLGPLRFIEGVEVIDEPKWVDLWENVRTFFCPYMSGDRVAEAFRAQKHERAPLAITHYAFDGKAMGASEYAVPSTLRKEDVENFDRVILGHVHTPCVEDDGRIIYVGSVMHFDFGDYGNRYAWYFPIDNGAPRALPLKAPRFVSTTYPRIAVPPLEESGFLRVLDTPAEMFEDVRRSAIEAGWLACLPIEARMPVEAVRTLSSAVIADEQVVRAYVERQYPDLSEQHRQEITAFGLDCLREAQR